MILGIHGLWRSIQAPTEKTWAYQETTRVTTRKAGERELRKEHQVACLLIPDKPDEFQDIFDKKPGHYTLMPRIELGQGSSHLLPMNPLEPIGCAAVPRIKIGPLHRSSVSPPLQIKCPSWRECFRPAANLPDWQMFPTWLNNLSPS